MLRKNIILKIQQYKILHQLFASKTIKQNKKWMNKKQKNCCYLNTIEPKFVLHFSSTKNINNASKGNANSSQKNNQMHQNEAMKSQQAFSIKQNLTTKSMQRLKKIKQEQHQQQYQRKLSSINITTGKFNPFTAYLWIHRFGLGLTSFVLFIIYLLFDEDSLICYKTMGIVKDPFTHRKRFFVINPNRETMLQRQIFKILQKQVDFISQESFSDKSSQVNKILKRKIQTVLQNLSNKYHINFKRLQDHQLNYSIIDGGQESVYLWVIGDHKLVISKNLLKLSDQTLENLIILVHSLHSRYLHLQNLSFWQRLYLKPSTTTSDILKMQKTFISNIYSVDAVRQTIYLIQQKYLSESGKQTHEKSLNQSLKQLLEFSKKDNKSPNKIPEMPRSDKKKQQIFSIKDQENENVDRKIKKDQNILKSDELIQYDIRNRLKNAQSIINE